MPKNNMNEEINEAHPLNKVIGGYPVKYEGDPNNYRAIISEPMDDRQKEAMIVRAKEAGYTAKPNMGGGITIFVKETMDENKELTDNPKLQPGKTVIYSGTKYKVIENSGYVLTLQSLESGKELKINLGQLKDRPIKENNMAKNKKQKVKETANLYQVTATDGTITNMPVATDMEAKAMEKYGNIKNVTKLEETNPDQDPKTILAKQIVNIFNGRLGNWYSEKVTSMRDVDNLFKRDREQLEKLVYDQLREHDELGNTDMDETKYAEPDMDDEDKEQDMADVKQDIASMMREYIKERGDSNLMEHMDKHRRRSRLMEGATEKLFKLFNAGKTDAEVRAHYLQMQIDMPESFIAKLRNNWESLRKTKLDLTLADKEAEGFERIQSEPVSGMEGGEIDGMEETKTLASGLFTK